MGHLRSNPAARAEAQKAMADYLADMLLTPRGGATSGEEGVQGWWMTMISTTRWP
jgi:hypothetical protein